MVLVSRIKPPALSELDIRIEGKLKEYRQAMRKAENAPSFLVDAASAYADMDALLELRQRATQKPR